MNTQTLSAKRFITRCIIMLLVPILTATTALAQDVSSDSAKGEKEKVIRQVVDNWIQIGNEEFKRGFYAASEKALMRAKDYDQYLTTTERDQLNGLLQKSHKAALERENALAEMRAADELTEKQKFGEAKTHLETIQTSEFLTDVERQKVKEQLNTIDKKLGPQKDAEVKEENNEPAAKPAQSRTEIPAVAKLNNDPVKPTFQTKEQPSAVTAEVKEVAKPAVVTGVQKESQSLATASAEPEPEQTGYIAAVTRRRNVIRSRVDAVVNDAVNHAEADMSQGQFDKAQEAVDTATRVVSENQQQLGDNLVKQHNDRLAQLSDRIAAGKKLQSQNTEEEKRLKAEDAQRGYKEQMSADRQKRVADLMTNALNFQKQQRYKEAIGQLDMLLAIEPQNNQALILRQTLEDMVNFRQQIDLEKEKNKERVSLMKGTEEAVIPYADEMRHPKNWREIISKPTRQVEEAIGQDPVNAQVEKALDETVDLSKLSPEMPLGEAIKTLKNSVDPPLEIYVNWNDLRTNANIDQTTPINMDPMTKVRLRLALDLLLRSVSAGVAELTYIVKDGVVNVATKQALPPEMETRVYDVSVLVGRPADYYVSASGGGQGGGGGGGGQGGGGGGGGGGAGGGYYSEQFQETEQDQDRTSLRQEATQRMDNLRLLIQDTVSPDSWYDAGGQATITAYENKKLVIWQTPENHRLVAKMIKDMREALGNQVAIEARFLVVGENFLEEIGLDVFAQIDLGDRFGQSVWRLDSFEMAAPASTGLTGSFGFTDQTQGVQFPPGYIPPGGSTTQVLPGGAMMGFFGGKFGGILDNLQADFLIRATQAHRDTESLVAPKVTVLSGESATLQVRRTIRFPLLPSISASGGGLGAGGGGLGGGSSIQQNYGEIPTGPTLNITPTITPDKKHVLLNIVAELWDFLGYETTKVETIVPGTVAGVPTTVQQYAVTLPQTERSRVKTRVNVPDSGTLLLGGLKRSASNETEVGVPVLSKIPLLGRLFTNRSKVADRKILLILVKPTIILTEEADNEAIAAMEGQPK